MIIHLFNSSLVSGPETLVIPALPELARELGEIQVGNLAETRKGEASQAPMDYARGFGLKTFEVETRKRLDFRAVRELARQLAEKKPTLVHAHDAKASVYLALATLLLKTTGRKQARRVTWKLVSTHHGVHARAGTQVRAYELLYSFAFLRLFDAVLCVCSADREILIRRGLDPEKVRVHLNGVDRPTVSPEARPILQAKIRNDWQLDLGLDLSNRAVLGVAARLSPEKNHLLILESLAALRAQAPDLRWVCICFGTGPAESELQEKTRELGLADVVHWAGYRKNLTHQMAGFDLLISLSNGEGLPINLLEAGWSGTPILGKTVDGVADLLPENDKELTLSRIEPPSARADEIAKRLQRILSDAAVRENLGRQFQQRVAKFFSGAAWRQRLMEIYKSIP